MHEVIIGSQNQGKVDAVKQGFDQMLDYKTYTFRGVNVPSQVEAQPFGDNEIWQGAYTRATTAQQKYPQASYWTGLEAGVDELRGKLYVFSWAIVKSPSITGDGRTLSFALPEGLAELIKGGMEMAEAEVAYYEQESDRQGNGVLGRLTHDHITRISYQRDAVIAALIPHREEDIYRRSQNQHDLYQRIKNVSI